MGSRGRGVVAQLVAVVHLVMKQQATQSVQTLNAQPSEPESSRPANLAARSAIACSTISCARWRCSSSLNSSLKLVPLETMRHSVSAPLQICTVLARRLALAVVLAGVAREAGVQFVSFSGDEARACCGTCPADEASAETSDQRGGRTGTTGSVQSLNALSLMSLAEPEAWEAFRV